MDNINLLIIFYLIIVASYFSPKIATIGYKKMTERELLSIAPQYFGIKKKYLTWGGTASLIIFFAIQVGLELAKIFPEVKTGLYLLTGVVSISFFPLCQAMFAFVNGVYPSGRQEDFVFAGRHIINMLAIRGVFLVFLLIGLAFIFAICPGSLT